MKTFITILATLILVNFMAYMFVEAWDREETIREQQNIVRGAK